MRRLHGRLLVGLVLGVAVLQPRTAAALDGSFLPPGSCGPSARQKYGKPKPIPGTNLMGWRQQETEVMRGTTTIFTTNPKPGDKIVKVVEPETDDLGNSFEVWCIEVAGGVGNSFGYRYVPKGGNGVWVGRCAFDGGINTPTKESSGDKDKNGNPDSWTKITHTSKDPKTGKDFDWEYDPATGNLKRWETLNRKRIRQDPDFNGPAPTDFNDLFASAPPNPGEDETGDPANIRLVQNTGRFWNFELSGSPFPALGTELFAGDSWSMAVAGILGVSSPVDWTAVFTSDYVTWTYAGPVPLNITDQPESGFTLELSQPFTSGDWISDSVDNDLANFGWAGSVIANVAPEPSSFVLLGSGFAALLAVRWRRKRAVGRSS